MKNKSNKSHDSKWVYFVYNWGSPIGVFTNVVFAAALFRKLCYQWGNPPEGALTVVRYRPAADFSTFKQEDITDSIRKFVCKVDDSDDNLPF